MSKSLVNCFHIDFNKFLFLFIDAECSLSPSQEDNAETDEQELGVYNFSFHTFFVSNYVIVENLQVSWHSLVYRLFQAKVSIGYVGNVKGFA